ncbi:hypothetical protein Q31b_27060 [Novipirellula aureliae]|uniref:Uncharacterized protein n=1 Tax=Novipirellula aureliae TaxID=2527966 RepID=A0A5C6DZQ9_9BACT|nr:hypothetical protein Q31b_27060 [Novipirellula aureliae]
MTIRFDSRVHLILMDHGDLKLLDRRAGKPSFSLLCDQE